jgi:hypothetical protein
MQAKIAQLERNQRVNNIGNAAIENGALVINDGSGNQVLSLGLQPDGTYTSVSSDPASTPLPPSIPLLVATSLGLMITWDGNMQDGSTPLSDFAMVQVHVSMTPGFTPGSATLVGVMPSSGSINVTGLTAQATYYCCLVAVNETGTTSGPGLYSSALTQAVGAQHVAANSFGLNMIPDPQFTQAALNASRAADAQNTGTWAFGGGTATCEPSSGGAQLVLLSSATPPVWVSPGEQYYVSATVQVNIACTIYVTLQTDGGAVYMSLAAGGAGTYTVSGVVTVPAGATGAYFRVSTIAGGSVTMVVSVPVLQGASLFSPTIFGIDWITNSQGAFYYNGVPGVNSLSASVVPGLASVTDPFGNEALSGFTTYANIGATYFAVQNDLLAVNVWANTSQSGWSSSISAMSYQVGTSGGSITSLTNQMRGNVTSSDGTLTRPTVITTDSFTNCSINTGNFTNVSGEELSVCLMPDNTVAIRGRVTTSVAPANPATLGAVPSGYFPARTEPLIVVETGASPFTGVSHYAQVDGSGTIKVYGALTVGAAMSFQSRYPLDS